MTSHYLFQNNQPAIDRLNFQYDACERIFGNHIPDHILTALQSTDSPRILDIATGTAVWILDNNSFLQSKGISAQFRGLDITTDKFPPKASLPENVSLDQHDMLAAPDSSNHDKYDVVHIRFVCFACRADELTNLCHNAFTVLKQGGWLIWEDITFDQSRPRFHLSSTLKDKSNPIPHADSMLEDILGLMSKTGIAPDAISHVPVTLEEIGMTDIKDDEYHSYNEDMQTRADIRKIYRDSVTEAFELAESKMEEWGLHSKNLRDIRKEIDVIEKEEWDSGAGFDYVYHVFTARKQG